MFVPVACSRCGKPFQVPDSAVGKPTACPWCQAAVLALPVGGLPPVDPPAADRTPPTAPLSLDDEPLTRTNARSRRWVFLLALLVAVMATLLTIAGLRRNEGYLVSREWRAFTAPDNSCSVDLLGAPIEDSSAPESGQRRYLSIGWYSGTTTWIGWRNLTAVETQIAATDEAWHDPQLMKLFDAERDWLKEKFGGYVAKDATIKFKEPLTREVWLERPPGQGRAIDRMIIHSTGPRPRVYFIGIAGKRLDPEGEEVKHLIDSFRIVE